ncbi:MAG: indole-3-glycerol phosphate synthase [Cyclobacteriaceae bacterium]|nr:MAG: indole-3-glycerol phosphate synthase [Cyclobacteriaceae bacterium]
MDILEKILKHKQQEVREKKSLFPVELLKKSIYFETPCVSMKKYLLREDRWGIIAEFKRKSPSKGIINDHSSVEKVSIGYMQAGASGLSVLTDQHFFGGKNQDLTTARKFNFCPILRKDFIVDEYQILEAKSIGADTILLIAAGLDPSETKKYAEFAHSLGLEVLLEVHNKKELDHHLNPHLDMVGVNNRDLKNFHVSVETSKQLVSSIPDEFVKVSESGISDPETIVELRDCGFNGFLIGQNFMMHNRPENHCREFIKRLRNIYSQQQSAL